MSFLSTSSSFPFEFFSVYDSFIRPLLPTKFKRWIGGCRTRRIVHSVCVGEPERAAPPLSPFFSFGRFSVSIFFVVFSGPADRRLYRRAVYRLSCYRAFQLSESPCCSLLCSVSAGYSAEAELCSAGRATGLCCCALLCGRDRVTRFHQDPFETSLFFILGGCDCVVLSVLLIVF